MGYPYGMFRYGSHRYSALPDWWLNRACENDQWGDIECLPPAWTSETPPTINPWQPHVVSRTGTMLPVGYVSGFRPAKGR